MMPFDHERVARLLKIRQYIANGKSLKEIAPLVGLTRAGLADALYRAIKEEGCLNSANWACVGIRKGLIK